uniref:Tubulin tyrosine ligase-like family, member 4 n=1 Tax=Salarias fasciatus TaxID=181472 RepID=A0A672I209_SALFA
SQLFLSSCCSSCFLLTPPALRRTTPPSAIRRTGRLPLHDGHVSVDIEEPMSAEDVEEHPALVPSLFPLTAPTLYFSTANEKVELLPAEQRRLLKWKLTTVTPNVVKHTIARSHFKVTKSDDWLGCWGHHMKSSGFKALAEHQKPASARGIGIQVIHKWSQLPRKRPLLVQKYLHKPYLIGGNKFDLRIYVYVTSYDPLRVYIFSDGLVRFASCKYSSSMKTLSNKFMHLTNYSVNKKNAEYQSNSDDKACQGHKWALKALWQYLGCRGINTTLIWEKIKDIVIKTIIASEPYVNSLLKMNVRSTYSCHELFGFDIMLDENLKPWILEVNISPSLHSNTALDVSIKGQMIRDLLNLAGFRIPQREELLSPCSSASSSSSSLCGGSRERSRVELSADEKVKRAFYLTQRYAEQDFLSSVLDVLTPEDVRVLSESEDELSRRGDFERIFPAAPSSRYLRFFECPRYLNLLLDQWEQRHWSNRTKGIDLLRTLCQRGVHLGTNDPAHMVSNNTISSTASTQLLLYNLCVRVCTCVCLQWSKCSYISRCEAQRQDLVSPSRSRYTSLLASVPGCVSVSPTVSHIVFCTLQSVSQPSHRGGLFRPGRVFSLQPADVPES